MEAQRSRGGRLSEAGVDAETAVVIVNEVLATTQLDPPLADAETPLDTLGLTSLDFAEIFVALEEAAGGEIDPQSMTEMTIVRDLVGLRRL